MDPSNQNVISRQRRLTLFQLFVAVPVIGELLFGSARASGSFDSRLLLWAAIIAVVELLPVSGWGGLQVSMGFPLLMAVGFLYDPVLAACTAFVGSFDPRELRREVGLIRALFNRAQVALSVLAASAVFHSIAPSWSSLGRVLVGALMAAIADY
ncbi:MAG: hypothetical protein LC674_04315, partial [Actinobacteria bacterium]|nr:hypothetical protein [Actinomycetota bacterium]